MKYLFKILILFFTVACSSEDSITPSPIEMELSTAIKKWNDSKINSYSYTLTVSCYCIDTESNDIKVVNNKIKKVNGKSVTEDDLENIYWNVKSFDEIFEINTGILFRSIGYHGVPISGVPFHESWGTIPNEKGRVTENDGTIVNQLYTGGWIKRGPSGIIGTNRACSVETVANLLNDIEKLDTGEKKYGTKEIYAKLNNRNVRHVNFSEWSQIDDKEVELGEPKGKPREKYTYIEEMLSVIK